MGESVRICAAAALAAAIAGGALECRRASAQPISIYEPPAIRRPIQSPRPISPQLYEPAFPNIEDDEEEATPRSSARPRAVPRDPQVAPRDFDDADATMPDQSTEVAPHLRQQVVTYPTREGPGTVVIDTANTYLYYVLDGGRAIRYGIGVGREGFTWSGVRAIDRKVEWPDWEPPAEMIARQPYLPRWIAGGPGNPLGARAMYLKGTLYRIHGTNDPSSIGKRMSSGCIRMLNEDAIDLYNRVRLGTKVVVLPDTHRRTPVDSDVVRALPDVEMRRTDDSSRLSRTPFRLPTSNLY